MKSLMFAAVATAIIVCVAAVIGGCASFHARQVQRGLDGERLTVGVVQREISKGMSAGEVLEKLGSPNIVSTDEHGWEVWVYDKFATEVVSSGSGWSVFGVGGGAGGSGGGAGGAGLGGSSGAASKSQRTLTIIIKYDAEKRVRDFAYHASRF